MFTVLARLTTRRVDPVTAFKTRLLPTVRSQAGHRREFSSFLPFLLAAGGHKSTHSVPPATIVPVKKAYHSKPNFVQEGGNKKSGRKSGDAKKRVLPKEVSRNVEVLWCDNDQGRTCDVYLVGTRHDTEESCRKVQAVISFLKPQVVFLELCASRTGMLTGWLTKVACERGVCRSEFKVAYEEAMKYGGKVVLGDRLEEITMKRTWAKLSLWHTFKSLRSFPSEICKALDVDYTDLEQALNKFREMDRDNKSTLARQVLRKLFPVLSETMLDERDQYMSFELLKIARKHTSVVAVVGKAHLQGIKSYWKQPVEIDKLLEIPPRSPVFTPARVAVFGAVIAYAIHLAS